MYDLEHPSGVLGEYVLTSRCFPSIVHGVDGWKFPVVEMSERLLEEEQFQESMEDPSVQRGHT